MSFTYNQPRPSIAADVVLFGMGASALQVLLIRRRHPPFQDKSAVPGGFVEPNEDLLAAARRELSEETGLDNVPLDQFYTFGSPGRDPRGPVVSVAHCGVVDLTALQLRAGSDAADVGWFGLKRLPRLAFDHADMIRRALQSMRTRLRYIPLAQDLLPRTFTLDQLRQKYELVLGQSLDHRKFTRAMRANGLLRCRTVASSESKMYSWNPRVHRQALQVGWWLDLASLTVKKERN